MVRALLLYAEFSIGTSGSRLVLLPLVLLPWVRRCRA